MGTTQGKEEKRKVKRKQRGKSLSGPRPKPIDEIKREARKSPDEAYFTTGEICRLLGGVISRSTVSRMFDRGRFSGRVNPITGKREIKWKAVVEWLKGRGLSADKIAMIEKQHGEEWAPLKKMNKETEQE